MREDDQMEGKTWSERMQKEVMKLFKSADYDADDS